MKKHLLFITIFSLLTLSCKKETPEPEVLPDPLDAINYSLGVINILELNNGDTIHDNIKYAFNAILQENASLKITLTNLSDHPDPSIAKAVWFYSNKVLWNIPSYANDMQSFTATPGLKNSVDFYCYSSPGKAKMDFYENADSITKTIIFNW